MKSILIDYDGTLHDSDSKFIARFDPPARALGLTGEKLWEIYLFKIHRGIVHKRFPERHADAEFHCKLIFEYLDKSYDKPLAGQIINAFKAAEEECWKRPSFFPDALEFLNRIAGRYKVCLITGEHAKEKAECLEKFGRRKYFDLVLGEGLIGYRKTEPKYYARALKFSNSRARETVVIGDTLTHEVLPAKSVGIKTIWVNRKDEIAGEEAKPDHEVKNLLEALNHLQDFDR